MARKTANGRADAAAAIGYQNGWKDAHASLVPRIADLEDQVDELRQSLIGGVEGVKAGRNLAAWAKANDKMLRRKRT